MIPAKKIHSANSKLAFRFRCAAAPHFDEVVAFRGVEEISRPFLLTIELVEKEDEPVDIDGLVGERASLIAAADEPESAWGLHGIISRLEHVNQSGGFVLYRLELRPYLWRLSLSQHSRVFTEMSVIDVVKSVLEEGGIAGDDYELRLTGTYAPREHICQYRETDLSFLSRWLEREGLYYFFEHDGDRERLVICDHRGAHGVSRASAVRYVPAAVEDSSSSEAFSEFRGAAALLSADTGVRDYDYLNPLAPIVGSASCRKEGVAPGGVGTVVEHHPGAVDSSEASRYASLRAEQIASQQKRFVGHGQVLSLRSGHLFAVADHPREAFNTRYLACRVEHHGNLTSGSHVYRHLLELPFDDEYRATVEAIPETVQFRAARSTPLPRIYGYELAVIDGPEGLYAPLDDQGRYKLRFQFDEQSWVEDEASTWVRMAQTHGGATEGLHFPLRKGTEVMVSFLGGDPDRPVISGVLPNSTKQSPVTSANNTSNVLVTGGSNRLEMDDRDGEQFIQLETPTKDTSLRMGHPRKGDNSLDIRTDGDAYHYVKGTVEEETEGDKTELVVGDHTITCQADVQTDIRGEATVNIGDNSTSFTMGNSVSMTMGNFATHKMANEHTVTMGNYVSQVMGTSVSEQVGLSVSRFMGDRVVETMGNQINNTAGNVLSNCSGNFVSQVMGNKIDMVTGTSFTASVGSSTGSFTLGSTADIYVGSKANMSLALETNISAAGKIDVSAAAAFEMNASAVIKLCVGVEAGISNVNSKVEDLQKEEYSLAYKDGKLELKKGETSISSATLTIIK